MRKTFKIVLKTAGTAMFAVISIYWFELDKLALQKIEPIFRKFASKVE